MDPLLPSVPTLLVLRALEEGPAHGYRITRWVDERSEGVLTLKQGTLYPLLHQLEKKGFLESQWEGLGSERPMKVYALTDSGRQRLCREREAWQTKSNAIGRVLVNEGGTYGLA